MSGILAERKAKDNFFRVAPQSPLPAEARARFTGLEYFPPDEKLRFQVRLVPDPTQPVLLVGVSAGEPRRMTRVGHFEFVVKGAPVRIAAYRTGHESLFVPFRDLTSGKESYGAGRYLDLEPEPSQEYVLDFHRAYNPYCAYSEHYSCPLPPAENWLKVPIRAGGKVFDHSH